MSATEANFVTLAGVPTHYDRYSDPMNPGLPHPQYGYGTRGRPGFNF